MTKARILSFLMVVCLATTCMLSGTIAKYTTNDSNNDDAIVGKWGVILGIDGTLFGEKYQGISDPVDAGDHQPTAGSNISVETSTPGTKLVAPGTKNETGMTITLEGSPEVGTKVSVAASGTDVYLKEGTYAILTPVNTASVTEENFVYDAGNAESNYYTINGSTKVLDEVTTWDAFKAAVTSSTPIYVIEYDERATVVDATVDVDDFYYPVVYSFTGLSGTKTVGEFVTLLNNKNDTYAPNTNLSTAVFEYQAESTPGAGDAKTVKLNDMQITWAWTFEGVNDAADTILGALISGTQTVVRITGVVGSEVFTVLEVDGTDENLIKAADEAVAYLKTSLDISITVEQVD